MIGIEDGTGKIKGLTAEQVQEYDLHIPQLADNLKPPIYIATEVARINDGEGVKNVLIIHLQEGINKPYRTAKGEIFIKQGANKRLLTDNAEIMPLFQHSGNLLADEMDVHGTTIDDIDAKLFSDYFEKNLADPTRSAD